MAEQCHTSPQLLGLCLLRELWGFQRWPNWRPANLCAAKLSPGANPPPPPEHSFAPPPVGVIPPPLQLLLPPWLLIHVAVPRGTVPPVHCCRLPLASEESAERLREVEQERDAALRTGLRLQEDRTAADQVWWSWSPPPLPLPLTLQPPSHASTPASAPSCPGPAPRPNADADLVRL